MRGYLHQRRLQSIIVDAVVWTVEAFPILPQETRHRRNLLLVHASTFTGPGSRTWLKHNALPNPSPAAGLMSADPLSSAQELPKNHSLYLTHFEAIVRPHTAPNSPPILGWVNPKSFPIARKKKVTRFDRNRDGGPRHRVKMLVERAKQSTPTQLRTHRAADSHRCRGPRSQT
jgi:hypothetical protein